MKKLLLIIILMASTICSKAQYFLKVTASTDTVTTEAGPKNSVLFTVYVDSVTNYTVQFDGCTFSPLRIQPTPIIHGTKVVTYLYGAGQNDPVGIKNFAFLALSPNGDYQVANYPITVIKSIITDSIPPVVESIEFPDGIHIPNFIPLVSNSLTQQIDITTSGDVYQYFLSESNTAPTLSTPGWTTDKPTSYTFSNYTDFPSCKCFNTLYCWVRDKEGNISKVKNNGLWVDPNCNTVPLSITNVSFPFGRLFGEIIRATTNVPSVNWINYGLTTNYDMLWDPQDPTTSVNALLAGCVRGNTYYYRFNAANGCGDIITFSSSFNF